MEKDLVLRKAAEELRKAGCRVFVWQDDTYNRSWYKGDYTMLYYAFPGSSSIGYLSHGDCGMGVGYGRAYVPSRGSGSGCSIVDSETFDLTTALDTLSMDLPFWCKSGGKYPDQYKDIDDWYNSDNHNKRIFKEI